VLCLFPLLDLILLQPEFVVSSTKQRGLAEKLGQDIRLVVGHCRLEVQQLKRAQVQPSEIFDLIENANEVSKASTRCKINALRK